MIRRPLAGSGAQKSGFVAVYADFCDRFTSGRAERMRWTAQGVVGPGGAFRGELEGSGGAELERRWWVHDRDRCPMGSTKMPLQKSDRTCHDPQGSEPGEHPARYRVTPVGQEPGACFVRMA